MPDDINTSTVTIRKRDGTIVTQTSVKSPSGTKIYNTSGSTTKLVSESTRSGSQLRYKEKITPDTSSNVNETKTGTGGFAASSPPTTVQKVGVYAKLNEDGTLNSDIYTKENDEYKKSESTTVNAAGETVIQTAQIPKRLKTRIEAGSPTAIYDDVQNLPIVKVGGATIQSGRVASTNRPNTTDYTGFDEKRGGYWESLVKVDKPFFSWEGQGQRIRRGATAIGVAGTSIFTPNIKNKAIIADNTTRGVVEFTANNPYAAALIPAATIWAAPYAATAVSTSAAGKAAVSAVGAIKSTAVGAWLYTATTSTAATVGTGLAVTEVGKSTIPIFDKDLQVSLMNIKVSKEDIQASRVAGRQAELKALQGQIWYKAIGQEINPLIAGNKEAYRGGVQAELEGLGYNPFEARDITKIGLKGREYDAYAEIGGMLAVNAASEIAGRKLISQSGINLVQGKGIKNFLKIGGNIGTAGIGEGIGMRAVQTRTRAEKTSTGELALYGGAGFVSAGLIGGIIGATQVTPTIKGKTPIFSNLIKGAAYTTDVYEYAGDRIADVVGKAGKRTLGTKIYTPIVSITPSGINTPTNIMTNTGSRRSGSFVPININIGVKTDVNTRTNVKVPNMPTGINTNARTNTGINVFSNTNTSTNVDINTNLFSNINVPTNVNTPTNVNVPVNTPVNVPTTINTPISVVVPNARLPPILPLAFPTGSGGRGGKGRTVRRYVNELELGGALLKDLTGSRHGFADSLKLVKPKAKPIKRKTKVKRRKR